MRKTLCVAVAVLSLHLVAAGPLACDRLLKPVEKSPDLSGSWYVIAMSSHRCVIPAMVNAFFWPSAAVDVTAQAAPNRYEAKLKMKVNDCCATDPQSIVFENNTIFDVKNDTPTGDPDVLLQSGCLDCLVVKRDAINLFLLSRRRNVTAAELKEFDTQADCLGLYTPQILNTDHDYENCKAADEDSAAMWDTINQRLSGVYAAPFHCMSETFLYYPRVGFEWAQQQWKSLW